MAPDLPRVAPCRVSVVIPCYGQARFLPYAVGSVLAQTHPAHEIVVVDDGSPDDVAGAIADFSGVHLLEQENRGLSAARNAGLAASTGDAIVFLDADDRLLPDALAVGCAALADHPSAAFVWGFNRPIGSDGRPLGPLSNPWPTEKAAYTDLLTRNVVGPPVGVMFRRTPLVDGGGFTSGRVRAEDYDLYLRLARDHDIRCHRTLVAEYRLHDAKMSSDDLGMLQGVLAALDAQEPHVHGDRVLRRAWREGRRWAWRLYVGSRRVDAIGDHVRAGRWGRAGVGALRLLLRDPAFLVRTVHARMRAGRAGER